MSNGKKDLEEEYFHREDQERLRQMRESLAAQREAEQAAALKALHYFHCGKCGNKMNTQVFKGIEIEICPGCGAVLLDPGELEQLVGPDGGGSMRRLAEFFNFARHSDPQTP